MVKNSRPWIELNDQISLGEAAQEIAKLTANLAGTKITDLGPHLAELSKQGHGPTPNVCRRICSMSAEAELASGNANAFVRGIFPEPTEAMEDEEFDFQEPRMAHVTVTIDEEKRILAFPPEVLTSKNWSIEKAQMEELTNWPVFLRDAFGCDAFFAVLANDMVKAHDVCTAWMQNQREWKGFGKPSAEATMPAMQQINSFVEVYLAVVSPQVPLSQQEHESFKSIFQASRKNADKWWSTMASGARANAGWAALEAATVRSAGIEIQNNGKFKDFMDAPMDIELVTKMLLKLPAWSEKFRPSIIDPFASKCVLFLSGEVADIVEGVRGKELPGDAKQEALRLLTTLLSVLDTEHIPNTVRAKAMAVKQKARGCSDKMDAIYRSDLVLTMAGSQAMQELEQPAFAEAVLGLRGHVATLREMSSTWTDAVPHFDKVLLAVADGCDNDRLAQTLTNRRLVLELWVEAFGEDMPNTISNQELEKHYHSSIAILTTTKKYQAGHSIATFNSLHKAWLTWNAFPPAPDGFLQKFHGLLLEGLQEQETVYKSVLAEKVQKAVAEFKEKIAECMIIAAGMKDSKSWKEGVPDTMSIEEVLKVSANTLLKGPGGKVQKIPDDIKSARLNFDAEIARFGGDQTAPTQEWDDLRDQAIATSALSLVTCFESQLTRSLKKENEPARKAGVLKYTMMFASVDTSHVQPSMWAAAQKLMA